MNSGKWMKPVLTMVVVAVVLYAYFAFAGQGPGNGRPPGNPPGNPIDQFDKDGDGKVSKVEFKGPEDLFAKMDADSDGYITREEAAKNCPHAGPQGGGNPFEKDDANSDGKISRDEFKGPADLFDKMDADGNGYIEKCEMCKGPGGPGGPKSE